jgi:hypothetical protein
MTLEAVSFAIGGVLIATAIVGGGFEIKEIKMPKVGAGPRFFSLVVGAFFVLIGIGVWEVDRQALLDAQLSANALTNAPQQTDTVAVSTSLVQSAQVADQQAPVEEIIQEAPQAQAFAGLTGRVRLTWMFDGVSYGGYVETNQSSGFARVAYDAGNGVVEEVDQDLLFVDSENGPYYEGSNPRYASTQQAHPSYMPDYFRIAQVDAEHWAFTHVCSSDACEAVTGTEVLP